MSSVDLSSARAKYRRAVKQCEELAVYVGEVRTDPNNRAVLKAEFDQATGYHIVRIRELPDYSSVLEDVSLGVGDVVNNLRCALDHLTWQYACEYAGGIPSRPLSVYFRSCDGAYGQHKSPGFLDPVVWSRMHEFQPCRGVNGRADDWSGPYIHQLDLLTQLSNDDKHQRLAHISISPNHVETIPTRDTLPPWIAQTERGIEFLPERIADPDPGADEWNPTKASKVAEIDAEVMRIRSILWGSTPTIDPVGTAIPFFVLMEGRPIVATLQRLTRFVEVVLNDLHQNCP